MVLNSHQCLIVKKYKFSTENYYMLGLIHRSDRGVQYASNEFQALLKTSGIQCSMSRKGDC